MKFDSSRGIYPESIVWTWLPGCTQCTAGLVGHMGITNSRGEVFEFVGTGADKNHPGQLAFGPIIRYVPLPSKLVRRGTCDEGIARAIEKYQNLSCHPFNNCAPTKLPASATLQTKPDVRPLLRGCVSGRDALSGLSLLGLLLVGAGIDGVGVWPVPCQMVHRSLPAVHCSAVWSSARSGSIHRKWKLTESGHARHRHRHTEACLSLAEGFMRKGYQTRLASHDVFTVSATRGATFCLAICFTLLM